MDAGHVNISSGNGNGRSKSKTIAKAAAPKFVSEGSKTELQRKAEVISAAACAATTFDENGIDHWQGKKIVDYERIQERELRGDGPAIASVETGIDPKTYRNHKAEEMSFAVMPYSPVVDVFLQQLRVYEQAPGSMISKAEARELVKKSAGKCGEAAYTDEKVNVFLQAIRKKRVLEEKYDNYKILTTTWAVGERKTPWAVQRCCEEVIGMLRFVRLAFKPWSVTTRLKMKPVRSFGSLLQPANMTSSLQWFRRVERESEPPLDAGFNTLLLLTLSENVIRNGIPQLVNRIPEDELCLTHVLSAAPTRLVDYTVLPVWIYSKAKVLGSCEAAAANFFQIVQRQFLAQGKPEDDDALDYRLTLSIFRERGK